MTKIEIKITDRASEVVQRLQPAVLLPVLAREMDKQNGNAIDLISRKYLSFPRQGPTTLEGLRFISGDYRNRLHASPATVVNGDIQSGIGANTVSKSGFSYPKLHEFGGVVRRPAHNGSVRLRTDAKGNLVRQSKFRQLAVFARKSHVRAKSVDYTAKAHEAVYPARAPIQRGIADRLENYRDALSKAVIRFAEGT
jgi:hypothetical protein